VFALFAFIIYYNLMTLGQSWIGAGRLGLGSFMVLLHGGMLLLSLLVLGVRHNQWTIRRLWTARRPPEGVA
jgi:lipopolysaccharide export system permease protein